MWILEARFESEMNFLEVLDRVLNMYLYGLCVKSFLVS